MQGSKPSEKEAFWRLVFAEHDESGLSIRAFCRQEGVSEPSFYTWRKKIGQRDSEQHAANALLPVKVVTACPSTVSTPSSAQKEAQWDHPLMATLAVDDRLAIVTPLGLKLMVPESCSTELIRKALVAIAAAKVSEAVSC
jgi:transposase-like protein